MIKVEEWHPGQSCASLRPPRSVPQKGPAHRQDQGPEPQLQQSSQSRYVEENQTPVQIQGREAKVTLAFLLCVPGPGLGTWFSWNSYPFYEAKGQLWKVHRSWFPAYESPAIGHSTVTRSVRFLASRGAGLWVLLLMRLACPSMMVEGGGYVGGGRGLHSLLEMRSVALSNRILSACF